MAIFSNKEEWRDVERGIIGKFLDNSRSSWKEVEREEVISKEGRK